MRLYLPIIKGTFIYLLEFSSVQLFGYICTVLFDFKSAGMVIVWLRRCALERFLLLYRAEMMNDTKVNHLLFIFAGQQNGLFIDCFKEFVELVSEYNFMFILGLKILIIKMFSIYKTEESFF